MVLELANEFSQQTNDYGLLLFISISQRDYPVFLLLSVPYSLARSFFSARLQDLFLPAVNVYCVWWASACAHIHAFVFLDIIKLSDTENNEASTLTKMYIVTHPSVDFHIIKFHLNFINV